MSGLLVLTGCAGWLALLEKPAPLRLWETSFGELRGWAAGDPRPALQAFARSCAAIAASPDAAPMGGAGYAGAAGDWRAACAGAPAPGDNTIGADAARAFFESRFVPYRVFAGYEDAGLFTGYYEPQLRGSRTRHGAFQTPLYGLPADLVTVDLGLFRDSLKGTRLVGRVEEGHFVPYPRRADIERGGLPQARVIVYVDDPIDAFFLQIQGSGRVLLDDGGIMRAVYAGQNGQPYSAIGKVLIAKGALAPGEVSMQSIRAWLAAHPDEVKDIFDADASYVFFTEKPLGDPALGAEGAEGVALTPGASMAVDRRVHALGVPLWIDAAVPAADPAEPDEEFHRLLVAQDTGGAITGAVRGDVYWGYGPDAEAIAGRMKDKGTLTLLLPKALAARLGPRAEFAEPTR